MTHNFIFNQIPNKLNKKPDDKRIILNKSDEDLELYWGEVKNNKPNGKGTSEKYETDEYLKKIFNKVGPMWWKMYSKNLKAKWFINGFWHLSCDLFYWLCHATTEYENFKQYYLAKTKSSAKFGLSVFHS